MTRLSARHVPHILIVDDALDLASCARVRRAMDRGVPEPAEVLDNIIERDDDVRAAVHVEVDEATLAMLDRWFDRLRPRLEASFGLTLPEREGVSVLRYSTGGMFKRHRDWGVVPSWPGAARRCISVVLFLSTSRDVDPAGAFAGGALRLFDDDEGTTWQDVHPRTGTLIAFPARTLHAVTRVTAGTRDAVVDWFYEAET